jgi:TnpA family transposase
MRIPIGRHRAGRQPNLRRSTFLSTGQRDNHVRYTGAPSLQDLARYFHLDDTDRALIARKRGEHNRLGFAIQQCTVRYLGTFLDDPLDVPAAVLHALAKQLCIESMQDASAYCSGEQRWLNAMEIREVYGYPPSAQHLLLFTLP